MAKMKTSKNSKIEKVKQPTQVKKKRDKEESSPPVSEGARKLKALIEKATVKPASTELLQPPKNESPVIPEKVKIIDNKGTNDADTRIEPEVRTKPVVQKKVKKTKIGSKDYVDEPNVVFIGNVPLSLDKSQLIKKLGIDPKIVQSIYFRSLPVESKFARNKRVGIIRGKFSDAKSTQNAYVKLVDEKYVDTLLAKNTMEIDGHYLFINKNSPSSFSKFNRKKTIFVGRLPKSTTENELFDVFSNVSAVKGVRIIRDPQTHESKGFGFVAFDERNAVPEAIAAFNNKEFKGYTLNVMKALDHEKAVEYKMKATKEKGSKKDPKGRYRQSRKGNMKGDSKKLARRR
uniref:RNA recognition motif domain containing protein n=1 Tax=Babesia bovis TaxID=5865 RepID=S6BFC6_BABBO|nr:RNA recognition motif domain containing protein [Babesia bovis]